YEFTARNSDTLSAESSDLVALLTRQEGEDFSLSIRQQLQEINAQLVKVPVNEAAIIGSVRTLREHRVRRVNRELAQIWQGKPVLSAEDRERVDELMRLSRELKGSEKPEQSQEE